MRHTLRTACVAVGMLCMAVLAAPIHPSSAQTNGQRLINHALPASARILRFEIASDNDTVVYSVGLGGQPTEIWRTSISVPAPTRVATSFVDDLDADAARPTFRVLPGTTGMVYRSSPTALAQISFTPGAASVPLTPPLPAGGVLRAYDVNAQGQVIFLADQEVLGQPQLYRVAANQPTPVRLSAATPVDHFVLDYQLNREHTRVLYRFGPNAEVGTGKELVTVPVAGSAADGVVIGTGPLTVVRLTDDDQRVVLEGSKAFRSVPIDGSAPAVDVINTGGPIISNLFDVSRDGTQFLFSSRSHSQNNANMLYHGVDTGQPGGGLTTDIVWTSSMFFGVGPAQLVNHDAYAVFRAPNQMVADLRQADSAIACCEGAFEMRGFDDSPHVFFVGRVNQTEPVLKMMDVEDPAHRERVVLTDFSPETAIQSLQLVHSGTAFIVLDTFGLRLAAVDGDPQSVQVLAASIPDQVTVLYYALTLDRASFVYQLRASAASQRDGLYAGQVMPIFTHWVHLPTIER